MKKAFHIVLIAFGSILALLFLIGMIATFTDSPSETEATPVADTEKTAEDLAKEKEAKEAAELAELAEFKKNVRIVDSLKSKFYIAKDEFKGVTFMNHKTFGTKYWPNRCTLVVYVRGDGSYYTQSNYYADDWVFHDRVQIKAGNSVITSEIIEFHDSRSKKENDGGEVWEINQYTDNTPDIAKAIAEYEGDAPVLIRFEGDKKVHDVKLSAKDKNAIKESVIFANALSKTWNKTGGPEI